MVAAYYGMISHIDANLGRLLDALAARGDDTLVIFTSDHGDYNGDQGLIRKGNSLHPSLVRVPLLLRHDRLADPTCAGIRQELETAMLDWFVQTPEYREELEWR